MREIDALLRALATADPFPNLFNQYATDDPVHDRRGGAKTRLQNLRAYLQYFAAHPPSIVVIGEAAGYRGNRFTGIPFTSEYHCGEHAFLKELKLLPSSSRQSPWREPSASIVWETFDEMPERPMLWSTVVYHPHKPGEPLTNRAPLTPEVEQGAEHFKLFRRLFPKPRIAATGRIAQAMLEKLGETFTPVRHPSHGGKHEFQKGLWSLGGRATAGVSQ